MNRASFLVLDRHFALLLDLKMYLTSLAVAMWRMNSYQNWTTIKGQQEVRHFLFDIKCSSHFGSTVIFDRWPTHRNIRVLRRVSQLIELQACHRVFAPSRGDQDRERFLEVTPTKFGLTPSGNGLRCLEIVG